LGEFGLSPCHLECSLTFGYRANGHGTQKLFCSLDRGLFSFLQIITQDLSSKETNHWNIYLRAGIVFQLAVQFYPLTKTLATQNNVKAVGDKGLLECHVIRAQSLTLTLGWEKKGVM